MLLCFFEMKDCDDNDHDYTAADDDYDDEDNLDDDDDEDRERVALVVGRRPVCPEESSSSTAKSRAIKMFNYDIHAADDHHVSMITIMAIIIKSRIDLQ